MAFFGAFGNLKLFQPPNVTVPPPLPFLESRIGYGVPEAAIQSTSPSEPLTPTAACPSTFLCPTIDQPVVAFRLAASDPISKLVPKPLEPEFGKLIHSGAMLLARVAGRDPIFLPVCRRRLQVVRAVNDRDRHELTAARDAAIHIAVREELEIHGRGPAGRRHRPGHPQ